MAFDWSRFTKRITINTTVRSIYDAWAIPGEMERWFLLKAEYAKPDGTIRHRFEHISAGDKYTWQWHGFADGSPETGKIIEANGIDHISFTFGSKCLVEFRVKHENGDNIVELEQSNIPLRSPREKFISYNEGWTFYLTNLKSVLEGGIDLRNRNINIKGVINS